MTLPRNLSSQDSSLLGVPHYLFTFRHTNSLVELCNDDARAAIRAAFHDCGAWNTTVAGGCDGSLILAGELTRPENNGLQTIGGKLLAITQKYQAIDSSVTAADSKHPQGVPFFLDWLFRGRFQMSWGF